MNNRIEQFFNDKEKEQNEVKELVIISIFHNPAFNNPEKTVIPDGNNQNLNIANALDDGLPEGIHFDIKNAFEYKQALTEEFINIVSEEDFLDQEIYKIKKAINRISRKITEKCLEFKNEYLQSDEYKNLSNKYQELKIKMVEFNKKIDKVVDKKISYINEISFNFKNHIVYYNNFHKKFYAISNNHIKIVGDIDLKQNPLIFGPCNNFECLLCRGN